MSVWVVALVTCSGNSLVLLWRILIRGQSEEYRITALFIKNLAVADLLMGVYLVVIGIKDLIFRDEYNRHAHMWMSSWGCTSLGVLAMVSCEVSILILALTTMDRYLSFKCKKYQISDKTALYTITGIWLIGVALALVPLLFWPHDQGYYSSNGLCFPLHIDDPYMLGWEFSIFVFIGINFPAVLLMVVQYIWMFSVISSRMRKSRPGTLKHTKFQDDTMVAMRCFFIVFTDCLCWFPVVIIKIVALCEISISENLFAWVIVFIVPINSALNPVIYTFGYRIQEIKGLTQGFLEWCCKPTGVEARTISW
ncbi:relaxin receptor 1-like [Tachypleus tridentatus]|uniref:relaxin receptor 1-like n=1 Tax=Tachypleus tridentatus TaxID=6853 RepID=UPI003FD6157D